jgi:hypothetical protein
MLGFGDLGYGEETGTFLLRQFQHGLQRVITAVRYHGFKTTSFDTDIGRFSRLSRNRRGNDE